MNCHPDACNGEEFQTSVAVRMDEIPLFARNDSFRACGLSPVIPTEQRDEESHPSAEALTVEIPAGARVKACKP